MMADELAASCCSSSAARATGLGARSVMIWFATWLKASCNCNMQASSTAAVAAVRASVVSGLTFTPIARAAHDGGSEIRYPYAESHQHGAWRTK